MSAIILDMPQRSVEWFRARAGRLTGSRADAVLAKIKTGEAAMRRDLRMELLCERLTGASEDSGYNNKDIQRGHDMEPFAIMAYEAATGFITRRVGFIQHGTYLAGCSPDALVVGSGMLEVKCPKRATHLKYLRGKKLPSEYRPQVTHSLWITGAEWCDFVSFDDRFPEPLQLFVHRVLRADVDIAGYEAEALKFLAEVDVEVKELEAMMGAPH